MRNISQIETDVRWWTDEVRARKAKVDEAERTLADRTRELADAVHADQQKQRAA